MTHDLVEKQKQIEDESMDMGIRRYHQQKLPWQADPKPLEQSEGMVGRRLIQTMVDRVAARIHDYINDRLYSKSHGGARSGLEMARIMETVGPEKVAFAGLKKVVDYLGKTPSLSHLSDKVGKLVETQAQIEYMAKENARYASTTQKHAQKSRDERYVRLIVAGASRKLGIEPNRMEPARMSRMGTKIIEFIYEETGLIELEVRRRKKSKEHMVLASDEALNWLETAHGQAERLFPIRLPMVCPPADWTGPYEGGYITPQHQLKLVKTRNQSYLQELESMDMPHVYQAINAVQRTPWRVNRNVLDVIKDLWERDIAVGKLPPRDRLPVPAKPENIDTDEEARMAWRKQAASIHSYNAAMVGKRAAAAQKLWIAEGFVDYEAIYFPHQFDWRGRLYPVPPLLNPQEDDVSKGLLEFANGKRLGSEGPAWLAIQLANTWGEDKVSLDDRIKWTQDNHDRIIEAAMYPKDGDMWWVDADKPFQFLAACFEWLGYTIQGEDYVSHQPIAMDGSCSGLQHFSAMLRDEIGGQATNLVPSDTPQDIYQAVADKATEYVQADVQKGNEMGQVWLERLDRKVTKRPTMTLPYGVTRYGMTDQIRDYLQEHDNEGQSLLPSHVDRFAASKYISEKVDWAIGDTVVAAKSAMEWLQKVAKVAAKDGLPVSWTTPVGFPVQQWYPKEERKRVDCHFGGIRIAPSVMVPKSGLNSRRQASGIAPNYVHSMDASHLILTVAGAESEGIHDFAVVHDSFGCHASDAPTLAWVVRAAFVEQYKPDRLEEFRDEMLEQLPEELHESIPEVPAKGSLDIESVMDSMYFFA